MRLRPPGSLNDDEMKKIEDGKRIVKKVVKKRKMQPESTKNWFQVYTMMFIFQLIIKIESQNFLFLLFVLSSVQNIRIVPKFLKKFFKFLKIFLP